MKLHDPVRTVASVPGCCQVCSTNRRVQIVAIAGWRVTAFMPCPHCSVADEDVVEIRHYPYRIDIPRGDVA